MASPTTVELVELKLAFEQLACRLDKGKDEAEDLDDQKISGSGSRGSSSPKMKVNNKHSRSTHLSDSDDDDLKAAAHRFDALDPDLESQFETVQPMASGRTGGLTKFPPSEGCDFLKEDTASVKQLAKCYKALKVVIGICVVGAERHPMASDTLNVVVTTALWGVRGVLNARRDIYFKGIMGDNFKMWRLLNAGGILDGEQKLAIESMQLAAAIAMTKKNMPTPPVKNRFSNGGGGSNGG
jgi:hypothetical protein